MNTDMIKEAFFKDVIRRFFRNKAAAKLKQVRKLGIPMKKTKGGFYDFNNRDMLPDLRNKKIVDLLTPKASDEQLKKIMTDILQEHYPQVGALSLTPFSLNSDPINELKGSMYVGSMRPMRIGEGGNLDFGSYSAPPIAAYRNMISNLIRKIKGGSRPPDVGSVFPNIQATKLYPIIAHELGHALDPNIKRANRSFIRAPMYQSNTLAREPRATSIAMSQILDRFRPEGTDDSQWGLIRNASGDILRQALNTYKAAKESGAANMYKALSGGVGGLANLIKEPRRKMYDKAGIPDPDDE